MPSFYVPKKNRCPGCLPIGNSKLTFATNSSMNAIKLASRTIKNVAISQDNASVQAKKGRGNRQKRGSGGNSYYAYLAKKIADCVSCCCNQLIGHSGTGLAWPTHIPIGAKVSQAATGAIGMVISFTTGGGIAGDIDTIIIQSQNCKFVAESASEYNLVIEGASGGGVSPGNIIESLAFSITETNTCS